MRATDIIIEAIKYREDIISTLDKDLKKAIDKYKSNGILDDLINSKQYYDKNVKSHKDIIYELNSILTLFSKNQIR